MTPTNYTIRDRRTVTAERVKYYLSLDPETYIPTGSFSRKLSKKYETFGDLQKDLRSLGTEPSPDEVFDLLGELVDPDPTRPQCDLSGESVDKVVLVQVDAEYCSLGVDSLRELLGALESHA